MDYGVSARQFHEVQWHYHNQTSVGIQSLTTLSPADLIELRSNTELLPYTSLEPLPMTINPNDLLLPRIQERSSSESTDSFSSTSCDADSSLLTKRQTRLRRTLDQCSSSEARMRMVPTVPQRIVDHFWVIYQFVHDPAQQSTPRRALFKDFYESDGHTNKCLLCHHRIKNPTQIVQHIMGLHFDLFEHKCTVRGCEFSSARAADLKRHIAEQHEPRDRFRCRICGQSIKHKKNVDRHMKAVH